MLFDLVIFTWVVVVPPLCVLAGHFMGAQELDKDFEGEQQS